MTDNETREILANLITGVENLGETVERQQGLIEKMGSIIEEHEKELKALGQWAKMQAKGR